MQAERYEFITTILHIFSRFFEVDEKITQTVRKNAVQLKHRRKNVGNGCPFPTVCSYTAVKDTLHILTEDGLDPCVGDVQRQKTTHFPRHVMHDGVGAE